jgi:hypothetical protein
MKGGKHGQGPRGKDAPVKGKSSLRGAPGQKPAERPKGAAPKKGARRKPFGGSSSTSEE